jgi:DNA repair protein RadC
VTDVGKGVEHLSDLALLQKLVGAREARRLYRGSLSSLLTAGGAEEQGHERLVVARELVARALQERMQQRCVLSSPREVREFLGIKLAGLQYEVFAVLFLDTQNALIAYEEMFRGTLSQTSVYPREVVACSTFSSHSFL